MPSDAVPSAESQPSRPPPAACWRSLGPGLITAAVVIGPGTITITSKIGAAAGMSLVWALVAATAFMMLFTAMSARIGILNRLSILTLVAHLYGRPLAVTIGLLAFVVCAGFQSSNYLACSTALATLTGIPESIWMLTVGAAGLAFVLGARRLYRSLEKAMTALVGIMLLAFLVNLLIARPRPLEVIQGLVPRPWPADMTGLLIGLSATTFSVIAALYQSSLAQHKGWQPADLPLGVKDSVIGIAALFAASLMIMWTAATVLPGASIANASDLSHQLRPLLGHTAVLLFSLGFLAAAFSSVVVNAMIGGALLADGLGQEARLDGPHARRYTVLAMAIGCLAGLVLVRTDSTLGAIVIAQKTTILTVPLVAAVLIALANDPRSVGTHRNRPWQNALAGVALLALLAMSAQRLKEILS